LKKKNQQINIDVSRRLLPVKIYSDLLSKAVGIAKKQNSPILAIVIGTKPDFYKHLLFLRLQGRLTGICD
jgi:hypothetical protein